MSVNVVVLTSVLAALLTLVIAEDVTETVSAGSSALVDGVLSLLGGASTYAFQGDSNDSDGSELSSKNAGERGIHKKKVLIHLWSAFYWWAWVIGLIAIKFKVAVLVIFGHLTYFVAALIRMLLREVPLWIQLKRDPGPVYGSQYGYQPPQYGYQTNSYAPSPYKRRAGGGAATAAAAASDSPTATSTGHDLAYGAHIRRK